MRVLTHALLASQNSNYFSRSTSLISLKIKNLINYMNINKTIISLVALILVLLGISFLLNINAPSDTESPSESSKYFEDRLVALGVEDIGQPIEGFDANLLIMAFPGLKESDFHNVKTLEGHYEFQAGNLEFVRTESMPISTAEKTISPKGYETLLQNVSTRLNIETVDNQSIDNLIEIINTGERLEGKVGEGASAFGIKIVPQEVLEDSRCPIDVTCIQAGTVKVKTLLTNGADETAQIFELNIPVIIGTAEVTLIDVSPQTESDLTIKPGDYVFVFEIKKL